MLGFLIGSFVIALCVFVSVFVLNAIRRVKADRAYLAQQVQEDIDAGVLPDWIYGQSGFTKSTGK